MVSLTTSRTSQSIWRPSSSPRRVTKPTAWRTASGLRAPASFLRSVAFLMTLYFGLSGDWRMCRHTPRSSTQISSALAPPRGLSKSSADRDLVDFLGVGLRRIDGVPRGTTTSKTPRQAFWAGVLRVKERWPRPALRLRLGQRQRDAAALALPAFGLEVELLQGAVRHGAGACRRWTPATAS